MRARIALAVELGLVAPGERLPGPDETALAFDVSEMTVRRAYRALQDEGILERRRGYGGGTYVSESPPQGTVRAVAEYRADAHHVHALIDQRAVLESGLARLAAVAREQPDLDAMLTAVGAMRSAANWAAFREADAEFHDLLAASAHAPGAAELHRRVSHELYGYFLPYPLEYLRESNEQHQQMVDALAAHDGTAAAALAYAHVAELHSSMYVGDWAT